jgi:hypothetical protein
MGIRMACLIQGRPKKVSQVKSKVKTMFIIFFDISKVKTMFIIFFDIKGILHKGFVLAGRTVNYTFSCDILQQLCYVSTLPFKQGNFFTKNNMTFIPHPPYFSVSPIERL